MQRIFKKINPIRTVWVICQDGSNNIRGVGLTGCIFSNNSVFVFLSIFETGHLRKTDQRDSLTNAPYRQKDWMIDRR